MFIFGCASDEQFKDELNAGYELKSYPDLSFICRLIFRIKNRKLLKQLKLAYKNQIFLEKTPILDESFKETIENIFKDSPTTLSCDLKEFKF